MLIYINPDLTHAFNKSANTNSHGFPTLSSQHFLFLHFYHTLNYLFLQVFWQQTQIILFFQFLVLPIEHFSVFPCLGQFLFIKRQRLKENTILTLFTKIMQVSFPVEAQQDVSQGKEPPMSIVQHVTKTLLQNLRNYLFHEYLRIQTSL